MRDKVTKTAKSTNMEITEFAQDVFETLIKNVIVSLIEKAIYDIINNNQLLDEIDFD